LNLPLIVIISLFYFYCFIILYVALKAKKNEVKGAFINNIAIFITLITSITINLILVNLFDFSRIKFIVFPFDFFILLFLPFFHIIFTLFLLREKNLIRKKGIQKASSIKSSRDELPLRYEIYRKLAHLVVLGIILFYFTFLGSLFKKFNLFLIELLPDAFSDLYHSLFVNGNQNMIFNQYLVIFLVAISLFGLLSADFIRILKPELYPLKPVNKILRRKELSMRLGPQISMATGCFSIIILYGLYQPIGPIIISTSMIMSVFGDMASNLIGRTLGKRKIHPLGKRKSNKTYLGLFAGIFIAFGSGLFLLFLLRAYTIFNLFGFFLLPASGAVMMGILDYLDLKIDDNLTYPFGLSIVMFLFSFFFI